MEKSSAINESVLWCVKRKQNRPDSKFATRCATDRRPIIIGPN